MSEENSRTAARPVWRVGKGNLWALRDIAEPGLEWEWSEGLATVWRTRIYRGLEQIEAGIVSG